jgi:hypothetical protein
MVLTEKEIIQFADAELKKPFAWGITDCNTIAARFLDLIQNSKFKIQNSKQDAGAQGIVPETQGYYESQILGKYNDMRSAIEFQKQFGRTAEDVLIEAGAVPGAPGFEQTGDFILVDTERWQCCHIYLCGKVLSSGPERGVAMYPVSFLQKPYRVMRFI